MDFGCVCITTPSQDGALSRWIVAGQQWDRTRWSRVDSVVLLLAGTRGCLAMYALGAELGIARCVVAMYALGAELGIATKPGHADGP